MFLDMVHHNPGEAPFDSRFNDPEYLTGLGYTGRVLKHLNASVALHGFPGDAAEAAWLAEAEAARDAEIAATKAAGLEIYYHTDLFVLPKRVVDGMAGALCDEKGRICLTRPAALEIHRELLDAMFARYPAVDGLVIRVGETYLFDTPHHAGNTAVPLHDETVTRGEQIRRFTILLNFLREEVCVRHGRRLIHRTWDYFGDRFHADPEFYLTVTDAVEPHPLLVFSIKHTAGDFFRGCRPNPCLGLGRHPQIVEVQCQREYEGKGAYPNYIARGVIEGFPEVPDPRGLRDWKDSPLYAGLWTWSRGGGWFGPYLKSEFWPAINARVLAAWQADPLRGEEEIFDEVCERHLGLDAPSRDGLRQICLLAEEAVWLGRSIPGFARIKDFQEADSARLWKRDDRIGGLDQLGEIFRELEDAGLLDESLAHKQRAALLFREMSAIARGVAFPDPAIAAALQTSCEYGARLFAWIACGWELMIHRHRTGESPDPTDYLQLRAEFLDFTASEPLAATSCRDVHWNWPGQPETPGMAASVGVG